MPLTMQQRARVRKAISAAFLNYDDLRIVVGEGDWTGLFNVQLEKIAKPDRLDLVVFDLVRWADARERSRELVAICLAANPGHPELQAVHAELAALPPVAPVALPDDAEVAIDEKSYEPPPPPLTDKERRRMRINLRLLLGLFALVAVWTTIFFDGGWAFWTGAGTIIAGVVGTRFSDAKAARDAWRRFDHAWIDFAKHRGTMPGVISAIFGVLALSLVWGRVTAKSSEAGVVSASLQSARDSEKRLTLVKDETDWVAVQPWGRKFVCTLPKREPSDVTLYPWLRNRISLDELKVMPYVLVAPDEVLLARIRANPAAEWTLTVKRKDGKPSTKKPYRGGAVWLGSKPFPTLPAEIVAREDDVSLEEGMDVIPIHRGETLTVEITPPKGTPVHTSKPIEITPPDDVDDPPRVVIIEPQGAD